MELVKIISDAPKRFGHHFSNKAWVLLETERSRPFIIGDNPLTLHNSIDMGPRGNLGLAVVGIEIYFPLSPARALAMWCPSLVEEFLTTDARLRSSPVHSLTRLARPEHGTRIDEMGAAIRTGSPLSSDRDNILHFNTSALAIYVPAQRSTTLDPLLALRED